MYLLMFVYNSRILIMVLKRYRAIKCSTDREAFAAHFKRILKVCPLKNLVNLR